MNLCSKIAGTLIRNVIVKEKTANNVVVSPLGFNIVLNMVAKNLTGPASEQLCHLLQLNNTAEAAEAESDPLPAKVEQMLKMKPGDGFALRCVNKALHDKAFPLQPSFHHLVTQVYKATVEEVDFQYGDRRAIVDNVNSWVKKHTEGLIPNIITNGDVTPLTRLVLVNALYFKGKWSDPFDPRSTMDREFHLLDGKTVKVPFMSGCKHYYHSTIDNFDLIRIPYKNVGVSMYIFLPNETHEFEELFHKIASENFLDQDFKLKPPVGRRLWIPKFDIKHNTRDFPNVLRDIVKTSICNTPLIADNIVRQPYDEDLFVGHIIQNSVIKVDEARTEAASATCMSMYGSARRSLPPPPPPPIVVDRPFLFMIREENSKLVLFLGAVTKPHTQGRQGC